MKSIVVLSDIHSGSRLAVSPERFVMSDGSIHIANKLQRAMFKCWKRVVEAWKKPDVLVINGEPLDGSNPKDRGVPVWSTSFLDQINAGIQLVEMFQPKKIYMTRGSNYHVLLDGVSIEEMFGEKIGSEQYDGLRVVPELFLNVEGVTINFAHHVPSSSSGWNYKSTPIAKEMMLMTLEESKKWPFDILVRSHVHYYWAVESGTKLGIITPCWKLQDWFNYRKSSAGTIPHIGAVRFSVDNGRHSHEKMLFQMPEWKPPRVFVK